MNDRQTTVTGLLPCPAVIVTSASGERRDAMTGTAFFVAEIPPLLSVSVAGQHLTNELIEESGEFVVNLATAEQVELLHKLGSTHGRVLDKFEEFVNKLTGIFKSQAVMSPGFHTRNFFSNLIFGYLGGNTNPRNYIQSMKLLWSHSLPDAMKIGKWNGRQILD